MTTLSDKRQTYLDRIERLQEAHDASQDGTFRAGCLDRIEEEYRLLARLDEAGRK